MMKKVAILVIIPLVASFWLTACKGGDRTTERRDRLRVVTTLFPLFDFAAKVGGEKAEVTLLLPPGVEPHDFEPKPRDLATIQEADVFVYTGSAMEPWAQRILKSIDSKNLVVVDASRKAVLHPTDKKGHEGHTEKVHGHETETRDPHIWLDLDNAQIMVGNILEGFIKKDPQNSEFYTKKAQAYTDQLRRTDDEYRKGLSECRTRFFLHGGHYAFNYLARRYGLTYISVHGVSPNSEPSPAHLIDMIKKMKQYNLKYIFYEALASPRVAETIAKETGASLLSLNPAHNATKEQLQRGTSFIDMMKENREMLRKGLECK